MSSKNKLYGHSLKKFVKPVKINPHLLKLVKHTLHRTLYRACGIWNKLIFMSSSYLMIVFSDVYQLEIHGECAGVVIELLMAEIPDCRYKLFLKVSDIFSSHFFCEVPHLLYYIEDSSSLLLNKGFSKKISEKTNVP